jgi:transposase InsO family protein
MRRGFLYLVAIMDWATRRVLAWRLSNSMEVEFCLEALEEAMARYGRLVHQPPLHRAVDRRRREDIHGWPRPLA